MQKERDEEGEAEKKKKRPASAFFIFIFRLRNPGNVAKCSIIPKGPTTRLRCNYLRLLPINLRILHEPSDRRPSVPSPASTPVLPLLLEMQKRKEEEKTQGIPADPASQSKTSRSMQGSRIKLSTRDGVFTCRAPCACPLTPRVNSAGTVEFARVLTRPASTQRAHTWPIHSIAKYAHNIFV